MTNTEKMKAIALLQDMVEHGYYLVQYKSAEDMINYYSVLPLEYWQESHDNFLKMKGFN